ncbi:hypothetical protein LCGC14_1832860 [marine sediment metagenome]|uniref:Uncharacterized protein n=1 Tax=marine sediment metagenome TaxID=412755 RepID=A0A0F9IV23_9ZZZZ
MKRIYDFLGLLTLLSQTIYFLIILYNLIIYKGMILFEANIYIAIFEFIIVFLLLIYITKKYLSDVYYAD